MRTLPFLLLASLALLPAGVATPVGSATGSSDGALPTCDDLTGQLVCVAAGSGGEIACAPVSPEDPSQVSCQGSWFGWGVHGLSPLGLPGEAFATATETERTCIGASCSEFSRVVSIACAWELRDADGCRRTTGMFFVPDGVVPPGECLTASVELDIAARAVVPSASVTAARAETQVAGIVSGSYCNVG